MRYRGKDKEDEWFQCELLSRAGRAKGKYSRAWNILQDGATENIDFERDVSVYEVLPHTDAGGGDATTNDNLSVEEDMQAHLMNLLQAAENREIDRN